MEHLKLLQQPPEIPEAMRKALDELPSRADMAVHVKTGAMYFNPEEMRRNAEEYECAMMALDAHAVARADGEGPTLSLWGRVLRFVMSASSPSTGNYSESVMAWKSNDEWRMADSQGAWLFFYNAGLKNGRLYEYGLADQLYKAKDMLMKANYKDVTSNLNSTTPNVG